MIRIGIDLGGTNIAAGIVTEEGKLICKKSVPTGRERSAQEVLKDLAMLCNAIVQENGYKMSDVVSIGIGSPGLADPVNGKIIYANNLNFKDIDVRGIVNAYVDVPVYVENDANCAALGESTVGAAKGYRNSITITLGTGVGGGIIIDNKIYSGTFFGAGELGHMVTRMGGEHCTCGRNGCWEAYASATALIRDTKVAAAKHPTSMLGKTVYADVDAVNAKTPFDAAQLGDEVAKELIDNYIVYVAEGITNLINIFQPEIIVIGGGVCYQGDNILIPIRESVISMIYGGEMALKTKLAIAQLGNDAGIIGAAMLNAVTA